MPGLFVPPTDQSERNFLMNNIAPEAADIKADDAQGAEITANPALAEHARAIHELVRRTREDIIAVGRHLAEAREQVDHGEWLAWLEAEFGWSDETARRFINVFKLSCDAKFHTCVELDLPLRVLYQLAAPKAEAAREEIVDRLEAGEEVTRAVVDEAIARRKVVDSAFADSETDDGADQDEEPQKKGGFNGGEQSKLRKRKSRFDPEHYASCLGVHVDQLAGLPEEYPERFEQVLDHLLSDADFIDGLVELARRPKIIAIISAVIAKLGNGADHGSERELEIRFIGAQSEITELRARIAELEGQQAEHIQDKPVDPAAFLDALTVEGMLAAMSEEFGRQLRARLPAPKSESDTPKFKTINLKASSARERTSSRH
jgi:hypothetical protein